MATGLDLTGLNGQPLSSADLEYVTATQSPGGAYTVTGVAVNFNSNQFGSGSSTNTPINIVVQNVVNSSQKVGHLAISVGARGIHENNAHLVGWNEDGLLFTGLNSSIFVFVADPAGAAANVNGALPPNLVFGQDPNVVPPFGLSDIDVPCFAAGTLVATPAGEVAVENLSVGDMVLTASGGERPVVWIGQKTVRPASHPRPNEVRPVRVRAGAFGEGLPVRDLRVSPGHAVFVDGVLIPAGHLVNGATIVQEAVERVRYFHIELDAHDVLLADGLPCESYLDEGNRASFANAGESVELHGRLDPKSWDDACAPMVAAGPQLTEVQQRLHARAEELGWIKSEDADLVIEADGVVIVPTYQSGNRFWFAVPAASTLVLRSNAGVLAHVMPGLGDGRRLGVAVSELRVDGVEVALEGEAFGAGFYPTEVHEAIGWRWTDGEGALALELAAPAMIEVTLAMVAPSWKRPAPALRLVQAG